MERELKLHDSSTVRRAKYDEPAKKLVLEFDNGSWEYSVNKKIADDLEKTHSPGTFVHHILKHPMYKGKKV